MDIDLNAELGLEDLEEPVNGNDNPITVVNDCSRVDVSHSPSLTESGGIGYDDAFLIESDSDSDSDSVSDSDSDSDSDRIVEISDEQEPVEFMNANVDEVIAPESVVGIGAMGEDQEPESVEGTGDLGEDHEPDLAFNEKTDDAPSPAAGSQKRNDSEMNGNEICDEIEKRLVVGSVVRDLEQAYLLYCEYGRFKGFGVRRGEQRYIGKSEDLKWKEYVCCCAGLPDRKCSMDRVPKYKKLVMRTGCKARLRLGRRLGEPWRVSIFENTHNHGLVAAEQTYLLRSSRNLSYANQAVLEALQSAGIGVSGACGFMEQQCGGPQNLGFTRQDAYEHFRNKGRKSKAGNGDAAALMEFLFKKKNEDPFFYWRVQLDDDGRLMNFFYRDSRCADDYRAFGDVLSVDTTYRTNKYNLICLPFVGINHHKYNILLGVAFLSDETAITFEWLFRVFLESMNGIEPKVIFTDQCKAMMNAIDIVFPNSKHRLCQWHINKNASAKFGRLHGNVTFRKLWHKCMNEVETETEFDDVWAVMIDSNNLRGKTWFTNMYNMRHRWASVFTSGTFSAGLRATSRSEGTNRVLKNLQRASATLISFATNYEVIQDRWRLRELEEDTKAIWMPGQLVSDSPLYSQAASSYTRRIYKVFESEGIKSLSVSLSHDRVELGDGNVEITTSCVLGGRSRKVIFNTVSHYALCSCRKWETEGIFCCHILKVYSLMNVYSIPESQILKRWTKKAREGCFVVRNGSEIRSTLPYMLFVNTVMRQLYEMAGSCLENAEGRAFIIEKLEALRRDVYAMVGFPEAKTKLEVVTEMKSDNIETPTFLDPKRVLERGFSIARSRRHLGSATKKGRSHRRKPNPKKSTGVPRLPPHFFTQPLPPRSSNVHFSHAGMGRDDAFYMNFSQP